MSRKLFGFMYIYQVAIAKIIAVFASLFIYIMLLVFYAIIIVVADFDHFAIPYIISFISVISWFPIWWFISDKICNYSYLKIYKDEEYYHKVWLKSRRFE